MEGLVARDGCPERIVSRRDAEIACRAVEEGIPDQPFESNPGLQAGDIGPGIDPDAILLEGTNLAAVDRLEIPDIDILRSDLGHRGLSPVDEYIANAPSHETECDDTKDHLGGPGRGALAEFG